MSSTGCIAGYTLLAIRGRDSPSSKRRKKRGSPSSKRGTQRPKKPNLSITPRMSPPRPMSGPISLKGGHLSGTILIRLILKRRKTIMIISLMSRMGRLRPIRYRSKPMMMLKEGMICSISKFQILQKWQQGISN